MNIIKKINEVGMMPALLNACHETMLCSACDLSQSTKQAVSSEQWAVS